MSTPAPLANVMLDAADQGRPSDEVVRRILQPAGGQPGGTDDEDHHSGRGDE